MRYSTACTQKRYQPLYKRLIPLNLLFYLLFLSFEGLLHLFIIRQQSITVAIRPPTIIPPIKIRNLTIIALPPFLYQFLRFHRDCLRPPHNQNCLSYTCHTHHYSICNFLRRVLLGILL